MSYRMQGIIRICSVNLILIAAIVLNPGCYAPPRHFTPPPSSDSPDLILAKEAYANFLYSMRMHQFDDARKYCTSEIAVNDVDSHEEEVNRNPDMWSWQLDTLTVEETVSRLRGVPNGDTAYIWWDTNPPLVFKIVKQNGVWLFDGSVTRSEAGLPEVE